MATILKGNWGTLGGSKVISPQMRYIISSQFLILMLMALMLRTNPIQKITDTVSAKTLFDVHYAFICNSGK